MKNDDFGDRMKMYEKFETGRKFMPMLPIYARLDGRGFSKFTKGMDKPFDKNMAYLMHETTKALIDKTHAVIGYTQSDEISLLYYADSVDSAVFFDSKIQKMCSVLSGYASSFFMLKLMGTEFDDSYLQMTPHFDCRIYQLPNKVEAANAFLWRVNDATKNAISMAAHHYYGHKRLQNMNSNDKIEMLAEKGVDFKNDYPNFFKRGIFFKRVTEDREIDQATWDKIPEHKRPDSRIVKRTVIKDVGMPPFEDVINRVGVLFDGANPIIRMKDMCDGA